MLSDKKTLVIGGVIVLSAIVARSMQGAPKEEAAVNAPDTQRGGLSWAMFNKNFGNIKNAGQRYAGEITGSRAVNQYKQFSSWLYGCAALIAHLRRYIKGEILGRKLDTIRDIFYVYAPPFENKTDSYIAFVARKMGISADARLNRDDKELMFQLADAVALYEDNKAYKNFNRSLFNEAWEIALKQS